MPSSFRTRNVHRHEKLSSPVYKLLRWKLDQHSSKFEKVEIVLSLKFEVWNNFVHLLRQKLSHFEYLRELSRRHLINFSLTKLFTPRNFSPTQFTIFCGKSSPCGSSAKIRNGNDKPRRKEQNLFYWKLERAKVLKWFCELSDKTFHTSKIFENLRRRHSTNFHRTNLFSNSVRKLSKWKWQSLCGSFLQLFFALKVWEVSQLHLTNFQ